MMMYFMFHIFSFFSAIIVFILNRKHFLIMLLSLEFGILSLYLNLFFYLSNMMNEFFFLMIFLIMSVCEGALGLSILVLMIRTFGNDYILSFSSLW